MRHVIVAALISLPATSLALAQQTVAPSANRVVLGRLATGASTLASTGVCWRRGERPRGAPARAGRRSKRRGHT